MNVPKPLLWIVLLAFSAYTGWVIVTDGYMAFVDAAIAGPAAIQIAIDLVIALVLFLGWMIADARQRQATVWPYVAITLCLGSIGPLLYLVRREG